MTIRLIKRSSTASAIAAEILDRQSPSHKIVTDDLGERPASLTFP
jgi:hypothetical protein